MQAEMPLVGSVTRPLHAHPASEVRLCRCMADAVYLSMRHAGMAQDAIADRIHITPSYLSQMMTGRRPWQQPVLHRIRQVTGSLATLQYDAQCEGVLVYADPVETRKAALKAELAELDHAA